MHWLQDLVIGHSVAHTVLILSFVIACGVAIGHIRIFGISLGIAGVLFAGLIFGHYQLTINGEVLEFLREFGLILFVFTIGMQVGPGFFASLRKEGFKLNALAMAVVLLGVLVAAAIHLFAGVPLPVMVGLLSGAVTNTPGLGAGQQVLKEQLPGLTDAGEMAGLGYAVAYPFGIVGIILTMILIRVIWRIIPQREAEQYEREVAPSGDRPENYNIKVLNPRLAGMEVRRLAALVQAHFVISRLLRGDSVVVPDADTHLHLDDVLHVVAAREDAEKMAIVVGELTKVDVRKVQSALVSRTILITHKEMVGKSIRELDLLERHGVAITRLSRAGIELLARAGMTLSFGDRVTVVGAEEDIQKVAVELGDSLRQLQHPNTLPIFVGVILGVLVGCIPLQVPGMPAPVKLGLAGGPLLVAILLSRYARIGPIVWYLPQSANLIVRELGISIFLACVGLKSGGRFVETLIHGDGLYWMALAAGITIIPLLVVGIVSRAVFKLNYLSICGLLAGSMTDPPALSFANQIAVSDAPAVTYASVYALVMFLRIVTVQILVLILA